MYAAGPMSMGAVSTLTATVPSQNVAGIHINGRGKYRTAPSPPSGKWIYLYIMQGHFGVYRRDVVVHEKWAMAAEP